jgi:hypothetical protein
MCGCFASVANVDVWHALSKYRRHNVTYVHVLVADFACQAALLWAWWFTKLPSVQLADTCPANLARKKVFCALARLTERFTCSYALGVTLLQETPC